MPLVVPETNNLEEWKSKLIGKKIGDSTDDKTFNKADLPPTHRILGPSTPCTRDFRQDRLNVIVNEEGFIQKVEFY
ncbi:hypothetical protein HI914_05588 [Erysiphe necator]|nr:hypothetical protein HI914_05588 [Erysiphe necator]